MTIAGVKIKFDYDFMFLLGLYAAEGCVTHGRELMFCFHAKETVYVQRVVDWAKKYFDYDVKIKYHSVSENAVYAVIYNTKIAKAFVNMFGAGSKNKRIPPFVFQASPKMKMAFVNGAIAGDGHVRKRNANDISYTSISKILIYDIFLLLQSCGYEPSIMCAGREAFNTKHGVVHKNESYIVTYTLNKTRRKRGVFQLDNYYLYTIKNNIQEYSNCDVYNLEVQDQHNYCANGALVSNCKGKGRVSFDPQSNTMKCLIEWAPKEYEVMPAGANIRQSNNRIKLKTYASNADALTNATKIMVPHTYVNSTWTFKACRLVGEIAGRGLKYNRYIEFMCEVL